MCSDLRIYYFRLLPDTGVFWGRCGQNAGPRKPVAPRCHAVCVMVTEQPPPTCHCGNDWSKPYSALVGWLPCSCAGGEGHRTYLCEQCGTLWTRPPHTDQRREVHRTSQHPSG